MNITVKKTKDSASILTIAESSKSYFQTGFGNLKKDLKKHILFGAYINNKRWVSLPLRKIILMY